MTSFRCLPLALPVDLPDERSRELQQTPLTANPFAVCLPLSKKKAAKGHEASPYVWFAVAACCFLDLEKKADVIREDGR